MGAAWAARNVVLTAPAEIPVRMGSRSVRVAPGDGAQHAGLVRAARPAAAEHEGEDVVRRGVDWAWGSRSMACRPQDGSTHREAQGLHGVHYGFCRRAPVQMANTPQSLLDANSAGNGNAALVDLDAAHRRRVDDHVEVCLAAEELRTIEVDDRDARRRRSFP